VHSTADLGALFKVKSELSPQKTNQKEAKEKKEKHRFKGTDFIVRRYANLNLHISWNCAFDLIFLVTHEPIWPTLEKDTCLRQPSSFSIALMADLLMLSFNQLTLSLCIISEKISSWKKRS